MKTLLFVSLLLVAICIEQPYTKVIHNTDPNAKCLDGTSPALYIHEGGETSKFVIFFNGGGCCGAADLQSVL